MKSKRLRNMGVYLGAIEPSEAEHVAAQPPCYWGLIRAIGTIGGTLAVLSGLHHQWVACAIGTVMFAMTLAVLLIRNRVRSRSRPRSARRP